MASILKRLVAFWGTLFAVFLMPFVALLLPYFFKDRVSPAGSIAFLASYSLLVAIYWAERAEKHVARREYLKERAQAGMAAQNWADIMGASVSNEHKEAALAALLATESRPFTPIDASFLIAGYRDGDMWRMRIYWREGDYLALAPDACNMLFAEALDVSCEQAKSIEGLINQGS